MFIFIVRVFVFGIEIIEIINDIFNVNNKNVKMFVDIILEFVMFKFNWKKERYN